MERLKYATLYYSNNEKTIYNLHIQLTGGGAGTQLNTSQPVNQIAASLRQLADTLEYDASKRS